jgi:hypothetical protein
MDYLRQNGIEVSVGSGRDDQRGFERVSGEGKERKTRVNGCRFILWLFSFSI